EYMLDLQGEHGAAKLRARSVPAMREYRVPVLGLAESCSITWTRPVEEYFELRAPGVFRADREPVAREVSPGSWEAELAAERGTALTFELAEQIVGWPYFPIDAPAGTVVELMVQEAHEVGGPALLNTHFDSWSRFTCREGINHFETFDFESCRWIQL